MSSKARLNSSNTQEKRSYVKLQKSLNYIDNVSTLYHFVRFFRKFPISLNTSIRGKRDWKIFRVRGCGLLKFRYRRCSPSYGQNSNQPFLFWAYKMRPTEVTILHIWD